MKNWQSQFVLVGGLFLLLVAFFSSGQFSKIWQVIWTAPA